MDSRSTTSLKPESDVHTAAIADSLIQHYLVAAPTQLFPQITTSVSLASLPDRWRASLSNIFSCKDYTLSQFTTIIKLDIGINLTIANVDTEDKIKNDIILFIFSVVTNSTTLTSLLTSSAGPTSAVISNHFVNGT